MDEEPEEYVKMKYSRDDETPRPWAINDLARPSVSELGFYRASDFGVLTKLIQQVPSISLASRLFLSYREKMPTVLRKTGVCVDILLGVENLSTRFWMRQRKHSYSALSSVFSCQVASLSR